MDKLTEDSRFYLLQQDSIEGFRYAKGFYEGHLKTRQLLLTLISLAEIGDQEWVQQRVNRMQEPLGLALSDSLPVEASRPHNLVRGADNQEQDSPEALEELERRLSRVRAAWRDSPENLTALR
jgi:hypothetical protein